MPAAGYHEREWRLPGVIHELGHFRFAQTCADHRFVRAALISCQLPPSAALLTAAHWSSVALAAFANDDRCELSEGDLPAFTLPRGTAEWCASVLSLKAVRSIAISSIMQAHQSAVTPSKMLFEVTQRTKLPRTHGVCARKCLPLNGAALRLFC